MRPFVLSATLSILAALCLFPDDVSGASYIRYYGAYQCNTSGYGNAQDLSSDLSGVSVGGNLLTGSFINTHTTLDAILTCDVDSYDTGQTSREAADITDAALGYYDGNDDDDVFAYLGSNSPFDETAWESCATYSSGLPDVGPGTFATISASCLVDPAHYAFLYVEIPDSDTCASGCGNSRVTGYYVRWPM